MTRRLKQAAVRSYLLHSSLAGNTPPIRLHRPHSQAPAPNIEFTTHALNSNSTLYTCKKPAQPLALYNSNIVYARHPPYL